MIETMINRFRRGPVAALGYCFLSVFALASLAHAEPLAVAVCNELAAAISGFSEKDWFEERRAPSDLRSISRAELDELLTPQSIAQLELSEYDEPSAQKLDLDGDGSTEIVLRRFAGCPRDSVLRMERYGGATVLGKLEGDGCLQPIHYVTKGARVFAAVPRDQDGVDLPAYELSSFWADRFHPICRVAAIEAGAEAFTTCSWPICAHVTNSAAVLIQNGGQIPPGNPLPEALPHLWDRISKERVPGARGKLIDFDNDGHADLLAQTDMKRSQYHQGFFKQLRSEWVKIEPADVFDSDAGRFSIDFSVPTRGHDSVDLIEYYGEVYWVFAEKDRYSPDNSLFTLSIYQARPGVLSRIGQVSARFTSRTTRVEMFAPQAP